MSLLEVDATSSSFYGDFQALYDVSLTVDEGETLAIIGANGAGKSTLLNVDRRACSRSAAARSASTGRSLAGMPPTSASRLGISLVPEGRRVFPSLTVDENLLHRRATARRPGRGTCAACFDLFPLLERLRRASAARAVGRRAAGARHRPGADGQPAPAPARRGLARPGPRRRQAALRRAARRSWRRARRSSSSSRTSSQALAAADRVYCLLEGRVSLAGRPAELDRDAITAAYFGDRGRGAPAERRSSRGLGQRADLQGVLLGGLYALLATGLSLAFGVMRLVNLAHGDLAIAGRLRLLALVLATGWNPLALLVIVVPLGFAAGCVLQRVAVRPARRRRPVVPDRRHLRPVDHRSRTSCCGSSRPHRRGLDAGDISTAVDPDHRRSRDRLVPAAALRRRRRRARRALAVPRPDPARPGVPGHSDDPEAARLMGIDNRLIYARRPRARRAPRSRSPACSSGSRRSSHRPTDRSC